MKVLHDLRDLKRKKMTIYISIPAGKLPVYRGFVRVLLNFALLALEEEPTVPDKAVILAIDELPVLGFLQSVQTYAGYIRGFYGKFYIICQNLKQLMTVYPDSWETFIGNNNVHTFANCDATTLGYFSDRCGQTAVTTLSTVSSSQRASQNETQSFQMFPLITPPELSRITAAKDPQQRKLIIWAGHRPIILQRVRYWDRDAPYAHAFDRYWRFINGR